MKLNLKDIVKLSLSRTGLRNPLNKVFTTIEFESESERETMTEEPTCAVTCQTVASFGPPVHRIVFGQ